MRFTDNYRLGSIEAGEPTNPLEDSRRFQTIDRQLLGLFQVFGNGIIEGWEVSESGGLNVSVAPGRGHVFFMSAQTTEPRAVTGLTPSATNYVYAQAIDETRFNRDVIFFASTTLFTGGKQLLLAKVTTNAAGVIEIDDSVRNDISFIEQIKALINQHRHRGGSDNPSKVDLASEVMGQLPGFRVEGIDASKIVSGRIPAGRIPVLEHSDLQHSGILTHAQLDSFVRNLSNPNVRLLGELSAINMLQLYLAQKHIWNEVDSYSTNLLAMIPGITDDTFTDYANTTALVDKFNHTIQGIPALSGSLHATTFRTTGDFKRAFARLRIEIPENDPDGQFFRLSRPFEDLLIEGFDNVLSNAQAIPGWNVETVASGDENSSIISDNSKKVDGAFSAKVQFDQQFRVQATKIFDEVQDWQDFNRLEVSIETLTEAHGQIRLDVLGPKGSDGEYTVLNDPITLLAVNETTSGFKTFAKDILSLTRDKVAGVRIYTDTALGWDLSPVVINLDRIILKNTVFYEQTGFIRFRLQTPQQSQWASISWDGDENDGEIRARARSGPDFAVFDQSNAVQFQPYISTPGDSPGVDNNTNLEIEIALSADSSRTKTPVVRTVTISYITSSTSTGLTIDSTSEFLRATALKNTRVSSDDPSGGTVAGKVIIDGRVDTGDIVYGLTNSIQQVDRFGTPVLGITAPEAFLSPQQAAKLQVIFRQGGLNGVAHVQRLDDRTYLAADALNDRVLLFNRDGEILQALVSNNARNLEGLYPIQASYNQEAEILYVAWSSNVSFAGIDLSKFTINGFGLSLTLSKSVDQIIKVQGVNSQTDSGNVTAIALGSSHAGALESYINDNTVADNRIFLDVGVDAVAEKVNKDNLNFATLSGTRGIQVAVGDIQYVKGIFRPVSVSVTSSGNWLICNAKPLLVDSDGSDPVTGVGRDEITSIIEVDPDTGEIVFSDSSVDFSLVTLGGAVEVNEKYVAMAGIAQDDFPPPDGTSTTTVEATLLDGTVQKKSTTTSTATDASTSTSTSTEQEDDFSALSDYRGRIKIVEKKSGRTIYDQATSDGTFGSDVQEDADGNLVIVEKYFIEDEALGRIGRGRIAKLDDVGNVFYQYGNLEFEAFNDVRVLGSGNLVASS